MLFQSLSFYNSLKIMIFQNMKNKSNVMGVLHLPISKGGHDYLYVVVDRFSNMCILMPCKKHIPAQQTAQFFFQYVWFILDYPHPSFRIKTLDSLVNSGQDCGE